MYLIDTGANQINVFHMSYLTPNSAFYTLSQGESAQTLAYTWAICADSSRVFYHRWAMKTNGTSHTDAVSFRPNANCIIRLYY